MHFGRSHARSKSRSPAPGSPLPPALKYTRPPTFLPPSHYAAAAGVGYSKSPHIPAHEDRHLVPSQSSTYAREAPGADPSEGHTPQGSAIGRLLGRVPSLNGRRKSQLGDIPMLETQLLPSLRDTVDKMTHPPHSRIELVELGDTEYSASPPSQAVSRRKREQPISSSINPMSPVSRAIQDQSANTGIPRFLPSQASGPTSVNRYRTQVNSSSQAPRRGVRIHEPERDPQGYSGSEAGSDIDMLRSGYPSARVMSPYKVNQEMPYQSRYAVDTRSKSNPGTPQPPHRSAVFATPQPSRTPVSPLPQSSLPRAVYTKRSRLPPSDSGSELERRVSLKHCPGRLVVTNAVIVPSSSESDHNSRKRNRQSQWITPKEAPTVPSTTSLRNRNASEVPRSASRKVPSPRIPPARHANVGLGLNVQDIDLDKRGSLEIDESLYDSEYSDHSLLIDEPVLVPASEDDNDSIYDDDVEDVRQHRKRESYSYAVGQDEKRRAALLGLVNGLHRDFLHNDHERPREHIQRNSSPYVVEEGPTQCRPSSRQDQLSTKAPRGPRDDHPSREDWDEDSVYSDEDVQHTTPSAQARSNSPRNGNEQSSRPPAHSLRPQRTSWKRPSTSLGIREDRQEQSPSVSASDDRRRSVSPLSVPASPRPASGSPRPASPLPAAEPTASSSRSRGYDARPHSGDRRPRSRVMSVSAARDAPSKSTPRDHANPQLRTSRGSAAREDDTARKPPDVGARERLAFGIPESLSYGGSNMTPEEDDVSRPPLSRIGSAVSTRIGLPRAESDNSVSDSAWEEKVRFSKELSNGAAALFETLSSVNTRPNGGRQRNHTPKLDEEVDRTPVVGSGSRIPRSAGKSRRRSQSVTTRQEYTRARRRSLDTDSLASRSTSPESVYDDPPPSNNRHSRRRTPSPPVRPVTWEAPGTWRSTQTSEAYRTLRKHYGPMEMERQEVIFDFFHSEKAFVKSSRHVIRTYFLPLRARDTRSWLPGLPAAVARLFDWLEDIVNLHVAVTRALASLVAIWKTGSIVMRVGGTLRAFIPQLEVYMPYLVKLEDVRETLRWHAEKDTGVLGEYLRMKEHEGAEGEWTLETLLEEPALRLNRFLEIFQRLCDLTPRDHPDHLSAISLLYAARMAVRVMEEVKVREDEYDFVKELASRIDGLSNSVPLARRARRLLWYGTLAQPGSFPKLVNTTDEKAHVADPSPNSPASSKIKRPSAPRMSKLVTAVQDWGTRRRAGSVSSSASSAPSMRTYDSSTSASSASVLVTPKSNQFLPVDARGRSASASRSSTGRSSSRETRNEERASQRLLNAMVFTDVIVFAIPNEGLHGDPGHEQRCQLASGIGLSRILGFQQNEENFTLDLISIGPEHLDSGLVGENTAIVSLTLSLPGGPVKDKNAQTFHDAVRKCQQHAIRSLSFPSLPESMMEDVELDTRQSLVGILSSGLPLPKSPSIQFDEASKGQRRDAVDGEREERGWWTLRFQQVLREMQREEIPVAVSGPQTFSSSSS